MVAVQLLFGQPPCLPVMLGGPSVVVQNETLPFLISLAGMLVVPDRLSLPGFCPGAWLPPGLVQVTLGTPDPVSVMVRSWLPSPTRVAHVVNVRPLSVNVGVPLKCTLAALATDANISSSRRERIVVAVRRIGFLSFVNDLTARVRRWVSRKIDQPREFVKTGRSNYLLTSSFLVPTPLTTSKK